MAQLPVPFDAGSDEQLGQVGQRVLERFPRLGSFDFALERAENRGPDDPRRLEFLSPTEPGNPNPGRATIQVFDPTLTGEKLENAIAGDAAHLLGQADPVVDPEYRRLKETFMRLMKPEEMNFARRRFQQHKQQFPEDRRSFEQWFDLVWTDMWLGGLLFPVNDEFINAAPNVLTKGQLRVVEQMRKLLQKRRK